MNAPPWTFGSLTSSDLDEVFAGALDRAPTADERALVSSWTCQPDLMLNTVLFSRPWRRGWPLLAVFSGCHGAHFAAYWQSRPDVPEVNVAIVFEYKLRLAEVNPLEIPLLKALFARSNYLVTWRSRGDPLMMDAVAALSSGRKAYYHDPTAGCFWPICEEYGGLRKIQDLFRSGHTLYKVLADFQRGRFDPQFAPRFKEAMQIARERDAACDTPFADFLERHLRRVKMFMTCNHVAPVVYARLGSDLLTRLFGFPRLADDDIFATRFSLFGAWTGWPETHYEWDYFKFEYPRTEEALADQWYARLIMKAAEGLR